VLPGNNSVGDFVVRLLGDDVSSDKVRLLAIGSAIDNLLGVYFADAGKGNQLRSRSGINVNQVIAAVRYLRTICAKRFNIARLTATGAEEDDWRQQQTNNEEPIY